MNERSRIPIGAHRCVFYDDFRYGIQKSLTLIHPGRSPANPGFQWISMHDGSCSGTSCNALYSATQAIAQFTRIQYSVTQSGRQEKDSWMQSVQWDDIPLDALGLFQNLGQSFQNGLGNTRLDYTAQLKTTVIIVLRRLFSFRFAKNHSWHQNSSSLLLYFSTAS